MTKNTPRLAVLTRLTGLGMAALLFFTGCQADVPITGATDAPPPAATPEPPATPTPSPTPEPEAVDLAEISVANNPEFGDILVGAGGMTLYVFTVDGPNQSNCDEDCLVLWPPLLTEGEPQLGAGVDPGLVGTAEMDDGSLIVTFNEMPLYYWINDNQPGDTTGQGIGGVWFVISPEGMPLGMDETLVDETAAEELEISVAEDPELGEFLIGPDEMTLYIFTRDEPNQSNCTGDCLVNWPPLFAEDDFNPGEGVDPTLLGTAVLSDGSRIATYNERPLYFWIGDQLPGDTNGQGVGDMWFVISPEGEPVGMEPGDPALAQENPEASMADISVRADPEFGEILVGPDGRTLYIFTRDTFNHSNCNEGCQANWPPLFAEGTTTVGDGLDPRLVGTAEIDYGLEIVTYNGRPLYYWVGDQQPGDTQGQGFGEVWYVISPDGEPVNR
jgi:predicted lipoprotein with Yx(FWY)xxD motif